MNNNADIRLIKGKMIILKKEILILIIIINYARLKSLPSKQFSDEIGKRAGTVRFETYGKGAEGGSESMLKTVKGNFSDCTGNSSI